MDEKMFWEMEKGFWTGGAEYFESELAEDAVMILPEPHFILDRAQAIEQIKHTARWTDLKISHKQYRRPADDCRVLVYQVAAHRVDGTPYKALCTSVYARVKFEFVMICHQQTPVGTQGA